MNKIKEAILKKHDITPRKFRVGDIVVMNKESGEFITDRTVVIETIGDTGISTTSSSWHEDSEMRLATAKEIYEYWQRIKGKSDEDVRGEETEQDDDE